MGFNSEFKGLMCFYPRHKAGVRDQFHGKAVFLKAKWLPISCVHENGWTQGGPDTVKRNVYHCRKSKLNLFNFVTFIPSWVIVSNTEKHLPSNTTIRSASNLVTMVTMKVSPVAPDPRFLKT
jgi:hypothetical protein